MRKIKQGLFYILFFLLYGCNVLHPNQTVDTTNITQLENVSQDNLKTTSAEVTQLRSKLLQDTAMSLGAQAGLAWASEKINAQLDKDRIYLESIFNFNAMMLSHGVLPPVLSEGDNSLNLADPNTIRVADKTYRIIEQARFTTTAPQWRDFLWLSYSKPELPDKTLLPRNDDEQKVWKAAMRLGWEKGIEQAYSIFKQNLARLKRNYQGMILYRKLLQQKMINAPFVARTELGVTGNGTDMRVNDQVLRIVELPHLQTEAKHWNAIVVKQ
ncbi:MAG TPA: type IV secretory system conjugative DNA transfer family protein [Gammaproteobacteria bacterium]|nr:type IV secretory system conjugative DNA transfer family protein [Gammaproteobacteria bacterium]